MMLKTFSYSLLTSLILTHIKTSLILTKHFSYEKSLTFYTLLILPLKKISYFGDCYEKAATFLLELEQVVFPQNSVVFSIFCR